jgi:adenylosuccinate synthase
MAEICGKYAKFRSGKEIVDAAPMIAAFLNGCEKFAATVHPAGMAQCKDPIFEGAQGLLLDQDNKEFFPHVTHSKTGMHNVRLLCAQAGITDIDTYYVSRTYLTRHGAGPLPGEDSALAFADDTNVEHKYQGRIRFAPLDMAPLRDRCNIDSEGQAYTLVLTHCDQLPTPCYAGLKSYGPTRVDVEASVDPAYNVKAH